MAAHDRYAVSSVHSSRVPCLSYYTLLPAADRANMLEKFQVTMKKMSLLGFNQSALTDCSDVIPTATGTVQDPFLPAGLTTDDLQPACSATPFPTVATVAGAFAERVIYSPHSLTDVSLGAETSIAAV